MQNVNVTKVAITLSVIQPITNDEAARDFESYVIHDPRILSAFRLFQQSRYSNRARPSCGQNAMNMAQCQPGIDNVFYQHDVLVLDGDFYIFSNPHRPG